ncbi:MAG: glycosyltransferase [Armatimonadota bacterium]
MSFSFIVPVRNGLDYTRGLVESVRDRNPGIEVEWVIVDSGSTDGTPDYCRQIGARVVPYREPVFNYCAAVNAGANAATGDLWIIANNDIEFCSTDDLSRLEKVFAEWPLLGVVSPGRAEGDSELEFMYGGVNGATWCVRPGAYRAWGGMPETMSGYGYDEAYTTLQCWKHGYGLAWLTGWDVVHFGSATFGPSGGNVSPALRRNLSRLLATVGAKDLDTNLAPEKILSLLYHRERERAPWRLVTPEIEERDLERQGYVNARPATPMHWPPDDVPRLHSTTMDLDRRQWLPWLANELLLQPEAPVVGKDGWYALRPARGPIPTEPEALQVFLRKSKAVGPPAPTLMPRLRPKRPNLRQRLSALAHDLRNRGVRLPEGW